MIAFGTRVYLIQSMIFQLSFVSLEMYYLNAVSGSGQLIRGDFFISYVKEIQFLDGGRQPLTFVQALFSIPKSSTLAWRESVKMSILPTKYHPLLEASQYRQNATSLVSKIKLAFFLIAISLEQLSSHYTGNYQKESKKIKWKTIFVHSQENYQMFSSIHAENILHNFTNFIITFLKVIEIFFYSI